MLKFVDIEVTKVPEGEAPEKIKKEWVGVRMPAIRLESLSGTVGAITGSPSSHHGPSYSVRWGDAVSILWDVGKEEAAQFWENLMSDPEDRLVFRADECKELAPA
ncbi:MAG: hypothetical protein Q8O97_01205 [bacterium]|nr:hypothetical protein [Candidatus Wildermuthbacteria bacterium]MDP2664570.1 hypothetical protein [bacterium]